MSQAIQQLITFAWHAVGARQVRATTVKPK